MLRVQQEWIASFFSAQAYKTRASHENASHIQYSSNIVNETCDCYVIAREYVKCCTGAYDLRILDGDKFSVPFIKLVFVHVYLYTAFLPDGLEL